MPVAPREYQCQHRQRVDEIQMYHIKEKWDFPEYQEWSCDSITPPIARRQEDQGRSDGHQKELQGWRIFCRVEKGQDREHG